MRQTQKMWPQAPVESARARRAIIEPPRSLLPQGEGGARSASDEGRRRRASREPSHRSVMRRCQGLAAWRKALHLRMRRLRQADLTAGTIMRGSKLPLIVWFWAVNPMATHSNGISALQFQKQLRLVSHKSTWPLRAKLRRETPGGKLRAVSTYFRACMTCSAPLFTRATAISPHPIRMWLSFPRCYDDAMTTSATAPTGGRLPSIG
jgi:hypothetical protein